MWNRAGRTILLVMVLLFACGCRKDKNESQATGAAGEEPDSEDVTPIANKAYLFMLHWPGKGWRLLPQEKIKKLNPDALAGAVGPKGVFGVVIVEKLPGIDAKGYARILVDHMTMEQKEMVSSEPVAFAGKKGHHVHIVGKVRGGVKSRICINVVMNQGFAYQVLVTGVADHVRGCGDGSAFFKAFELLEGKVLGKSEKPVAALQNASGVGWRVKDGLFESAAFGFTLRPEPPWRLVVGDELDESDAHVGMENQDTNANFLVVPEWIGGIDMKALERKDEPDFLKRTKSIRMKESVVVTVANRKLKFRRYRRTVGLTIDFLRAVHFLGGLRIQFLVVVVSGVKGGSEEILSSVFKSFVFLDKTRAARLAAEMAGMPDGQNDVGATYSYRQGVYRNFKSGITWRKPKGFWKVKLGAAARQENPKMSMVLEELGRGLYGFLIPEPSEGASNRDYHTAVVNSITSGSKSWRCSAPEEVKVPGARLLVSNQQAPPGGDGLLFRTATTVLGPLAVRFTFSGGPVQMKRGRVAIDEAIAGISFSPMTAVETKNGQYLDHRMGFAYKPPGEGWTFKNMVDVVRGAGRRRSARPEDPGGIREAFSILAVMRPRRQPRWEDLFTGRRVLVRAEGDRVPDPWTPSGGDPVGGQARPGDVPTRVPTVGLRSDDDPEGRGPASANRRLDLLGNPAPDHRARTGWP